MPDNDPERDMATRYRNVFGTPEGRIVLGDILTQGFYGVTLTPEIPDQIGAYNLALVIATRSGVFDPIYRQLGMAKEN